MSFSNAQVSDKRRSRLALCGSLVLVLAIALIPIVISNSFQVHLANIVLLNAIIVAGLYLISRAGQLSLCHAAFVSMGAYASAIGATSLGIAPLAGLLLAAIVTGAVSWVIGALTLRLRGVYFVLVTFLFGQIFHLILLEAQTITGGANGIPAIPGISILGISISDAHSFLYVALIAAVLLIGSVWYLLCSDAGRALDAIAEDLSLAESSGISARRYQTMAFVWGSILAGIGGALFAHYIRYISPESFTFWDSVSYIVMLVVGGRGSLGGALLGAAFLTPLPEVLRSAEGYQQLFYGFIVLAVVRFLPGGLISLPGLPRSWRKVR